MDKKTIMVVDDEPHIVDMMETYLGIKGYEVRGAYSGQSGLVLVQADKPDALLLDLMMPDIEGYEVCAELRKLPEFAKLPILIVSARTDPASKRRAEDAGADAYFTKPVNMAQLVATLETLFTARAATQTASPAAPPTEAAAPPAVLTPPKPPAPVPAPTPPASEPPAAATEPKRPAGLTEAAATPPKPPTPAPATEPPAAATQPKRPEGLTPPDPSTPKPPPERPS